MRILGTLTAGSMVAALLAIVSLPVRTAAGREKPPSPYEERSGTESEPADRVFVSGEPDDEMEGPLEIQRDRHASQALLSLRGAEPARIWQVGPYQSIQVNVDASGNNIVSDAANEPSMAISPINPNRIAVGWRQFDSIFADFREAGVAYSVDGGRTWSAEKVIEEGVFRSDPVLLSDTEGNFYYFGLGLPPPSGPITQYHVFLYKSVDGGATWRRSVDARGGDKEWFVLDRTGGVGHGNLYGSWNRFFSCCSMDDFVRSINGGASFEDSLQLPPPALRWGNLEVGPDGTLYVAGSLNNNRPLPPLGHVVSRSSNAQLRSVLPVFETFEVDLGGRTIIGGINNNGLLGQVWIATDHSMGPTRGNVYLLCSVERPGIDPADVMFSRSTDRGESWSVPLRVNDDPSAGAHQWFGTLAVAPNGRLDVIWNDTRNDPGNLISQVRYSYSLDAGLTWSASVAVSPAFDPHLGYPLNFKLGDYYQLLADNGGASLAYAATFNGEQDIYFLRIPFDCDGNGIEDDCDIACGTAGSRCDVPGCGAGRDADGNGVLDSCFNGNAPPLADAGPDQVVECSSSAGARVHLDGSASSDPERGALTYRWTNEFGEIEEVSPTVTLSLGTHRITLEVTDSEGATDSDEVVITVQDTTAPVVRCEPATSPPGGAPPRPGRPALPAQSGFFRLTATDACTVAAPITVSDVSGSGPYGPYPSGTIMKMTQIPGGQSRLATTGGGAGFLHLFLPEDPIAGTQDGSGNIATAFCAVPPSKK